MEFSARPALFTLETSGLIRQFQFEPELAYIFRHALVQDAAYDSLLRNDKRRIHQMIAEIIEHNYAENLDEFAAELARHYQEAGDNARAAAYFSRAGLRARAMFANVEAADYFRAALQLHPDPADSEYISLHLGLGGALFTLGRQAEAVEVYRAGARLCRQRDDIGLCAQFYTLAARSYFFAGDFPNQYAVAREGYEMVRGAPDSPNMVFLLSTIANAAYFNGLAEEAITHARAALEISSRIDDLRARSAALVVYGTVQPYQLSADKLTAMRAAADFALEHNLPQTSAAVFNYAETVFNINGDFETACRFFRQGIERTRAVNNVLGELWQTSGLQKMLTILGQFEQADALSPRLNELLESIPDHGTIEGSLFIISAVRAYYEGNNEKALALLEEGLGSAMRANDQQLINEMGVWMAEIALQASRPDLAAEILPSAIAAGDRNLIWGGVIPRGLLSTAYARAGQFDMARAVLDEAATRARPDPGRMARFAIALAEARLAFYQNRISEARQHYQQALEFATSMGLRHHQTIIHAELQKITP